MFLDSFSEKRYQRNRTEKDYQYGIIMLPTPRPTPMWCSRGPFTGLRSVIYKSALCKGACLTIVFIHPMCLKAYNTDKDNLLTQKADFTSVQKQGWCFITQQYRLLGPSKHIHPVLNKVFLTGECMFLENGGNRSISMQACKLSLSIPLGKQGTPWAETINTEPIHSNLK